MQLAKDIDVTQKTAWFKLQRIRNCFGISDEWLGYKSLKRFYDHTFVKHNEGEM